MRWTVRAGAIDAIVKNYHVLIETFEEIHENTHDEYGLKAVGFYILWSHFLHFWVFSFYKSCLVLRSRCCLLQKNSLTILDALSVVDTAKAYYSLIRADDGAVKDSENNAIGKPELQRYWCRPSKLDDGPPTHQYPSAKLIFAKSIPGGM